MANDNQIAFLCSRLKELREKNGCTMDDMAKKIDVLEGLKPGTGMNKSSISRVEGGKTAEKTLLEMARKYCKVFGMSESQTEQFLRGEKVAVPDTSALLKNSQLIDELNKEYSKVVIPKVVVDELDNIKNKNSGSLGRKAWEVIRGISYGSRTILMEYNGDADEDNEDCKIIYIAQEASDTYHCKIDIITEDTDYSAYLKGHESVSALHLREYMATKQDLINMTKLARIDAYYADSYEECEEPTADEVNAYLQDGNTLIISAVRNNRATIEQRKEKIKWLIQLGADVNKRDCSRRYFPALSHAVQMKDYEMFMFLLLECKANPNVGSRNPFDAGKVRQKNEGNMPLMIAAWEGKKDFVIALCEDERTSINQEFEINNLREECHRRNKDFYVVSDNEEEQNKFFDFLSLLREGFSSYDLATDICNQIMEQFNKQDILYMVDGDKTIIIQDSYRFCCNGKTKIFDGDFYTGYQSFLFEKELQTASIDKSKIAEITINNEVYDIVASNNYVVLSSGIKDLWSDIANAKNLGTIFASPYISADVKYYVVKQLREHGYTIFAYGDSKIDLYMLREADKGFLYIGKRISRSLKNESLSGLVPIYDHSLVILADEDEEVQADIAICKSNSGISGSRLAAAHVRLGEKIGRHIAAVFPEKNTSILVLERGGRFFGDGVYMGAGGIFYSMNPKQDDAPVINTERVVIVDSVINTGKSIMRIIDELKNHNPGIDVIIAANVIQNEAVELFKDYLVFATRLSKNSFVGVNQSKQTGKTGPDTADRLFNLIKKRY